jgi:hypothetical protein
VKLGHSGFRIIGEEDSLANFKMGSIEMLTGMLMCETPCGGPIGISISVISGSGAVILQEVKMLAAMTISRIDLVKFLEIIY